MKETTTNETRHTERDDDENTGYQALYSFHLYTMYYYQLDDIILIQFPCHSLEILVFVIDIGYRI